MFTWLRVVFKWHSTVLFALLVWSTDFGLAQEPENKSLTITFDFGDRKIPIRFRSCPPGRLSAGQPKPVEPGEEATKPDNASPLAGIGGPVSIDEFYLTETEITSEQFAAVLGTTEFEHFRDSVKKKLTGAAEDVALLDPKGSFPVFMVSVHDAMKFCQALDSAKTDQQSQASTIERRRFRLPSHQEWQYACRAQTDPAMAQKFPHFHDWVEFEALPKADAAKCVEEWKELGGQEDEFLGTQFQVIDIVSKRYEKEPTKSLEILSAFLRESLGTNRDYSKQNPGRLAAVGGTKANGWGFVDMHENVREWTIAIADKGELQQFWTNVTSDNRSPDLQSRPAFFLAGGSFNDLMAGGSIAAWAPFTIWGGRPMDIQSGTPQPFSFQEEQASDIAFEYQPGIRIVMDRVLSDSWLLAVRRAAVPTNKTATISVAELEKYRSTVREIVPTSQQTTMLAVIDYYSGLSAYAAGQTSEAARVLESVKGKIFSEKKKKANIAALAALANSNSSNDKPESNESVETEDQAFQRMLLDIVVADGSARH